MSTTETHENLCSESKEPSAGFLCTESKDGTIRKHQEELLRPRSISAEQNSINNPEKELQLSCVCCVRDAGRVLGAELGGIIAVSHV